MASTIADNMLKTLRDSDPLADVDEYFTVEPKSYFRAKAAFDRMIGGILLIPATPVIFLIVALVRLTSRGPGIYRQLRVGRNGRIFQCYKIRSMVSDAEASTGPTWTEKYDPRVTPLGRFLRKVHLDELPQLWNVVRGEMALIGPRPERPEFFEILAEKIPNYRDRVAITPGITGLAQINLPPDSDLNTVRRKLIFDMQYLEEASPFLDLKILLCTAFRIFGIPGGMAARLSGVHRKPPVLATPVPDPTVREDASMAIQQAACRKTPSPKLDFGRDHVKRA